MTTDASASADLPARAGDMSAVKHVLNPEMRDEFILVCREFTARADRLCEVYSRSFSA